MNKTNHSALQPLSQTRKPTRQHSQLSRATSIKIVSRSKKQMKQNIDCRQQEKRDSSSQRTRKGGHQLGIPKLGKYRCQYHRKLTGHEDKVENKQLFSSNPTGTLVCKGKGEKEEPTQQHSLALDQAEIAETRQTEPQQPLRMHQPPSEHLETKDPASFSSAPNKTASNCNEDENRDAQRSAIPIDKMAPILPKLPSPQIKKEQLSNNHSDAKEADLSQEEADQENQVGTSSQEINQTPQGNSEREAVKAPDAVQSIRAFSQDGSSSNDIRSHARQSFDPHDDDMFVARKDYEVAYDFLTLDQNANHSHVLPQLMARHDTSCQQFMSFSSHPMNQFNDPFGSSVSFATHQRAFPPVLQHSFSFSHQPQPQMGFITPQKPSIITRDKVEMLSTASSRDLSNKKASGEHLLTLQRQLQPDPDDFQTARNSAQKVHSFSGSESRALLLDQHQNLSKTSRNAQKMSALQLKPASNNKRDSKAKAKKNKRQSAFQAEIDSPSFDGDHAMEANDLSPIKYLTYEISSLNDLSHFNKSIASSRNSALQHQTNKIQIVIPNSRMLHQKQTIPQKMERAPLDNFSEQPSHHFAEPSQQQDLRQSEKFKTLLSNEEAVVPSFSQPSRNLPAAVAEVTVKKFKCSCNKNGCAKRYCDCLKRFEVCSPDVCSCVGCTNTEVNSKLRDATLQKQSKVASTSGGCNCKNSKCLQGYCECKQNDRGCGPKCKCLDCQNPFNKANSSKSEQDGSRFEQSDEDMEQEA